VRTSRWCRLLAAGSGLVVLAACLLTGVAAAGPPWGPENPNFNLEVILRPATGDTGFGHVKFRQPNDADKIVYLDTWVRDLEPNHHYLLERAVDTNLDGTCQNTTMWLSLGTIVTDERGTGVAALSRTLPSAVGTTFDIHFHVIDEGTLAPVLESACYEFTVSL